jgi:hypothetical protein
LSGTIGSETVKTPSDVSGCPGASCIDRRSTSAAVSKFWKKLGLSTKTSAMAHAPIEKVFGAFAMIREEW